MSELAQRPRGNAAPTLASPHFPNESSQTFYRSQDTLTDLGTPFDHSRSASGRSGASSKLQADESDECWIRMGARATSFRERGHGAWETGHHDEPDEGEEEEENDLVAGPSEPTMQQWNDADRVGMVRRTSSMSVFHDPCEYEEIEDRSPVNSRHGSHSRLPSLSNSATGSPIIRRSSLAALAPLSLTASTQPSPITPNFDDHDGFAAESLLAHETSKYGIFNLLQSIFEFPLTPLYHDKDAIFDSEKAMESPLSPIFSQSFSASPRGSPALSRVGSVQSMHQTSLRLSSLSLQNDKMDPSNDVEITIDSDDDNERGGAIDTLSVFADALSGLGEYI